MPLLLSRFLSLIRSTYEYLTGQPDVVELPQLQNKPPLDTTIENEFLSHARDWAVNKIESLHEADRHKNARALEAEFYEWIHIPENVERIDYISLEQIDN
jgi:hypothetical protein